MLNRLFSPWDYKKIFQFTLKNIECAHGKIFLCYNGGIIEIYVENNAILSYKVKSNHPLFLESCKKILEKNLKNLSIKTFKAQYQKLIQKESSVEISQNNIESDFDSLYQDDIFLMMYPDSKYWYKQEKNTIPSAKSINDLYVHIPFCSSKCHYCDFAVTTNTKKSIIDTYIKNLSKELESSIKRKNQSETVYIGGGTPSILEIDQLENLFEIIEQKVSLKNTKEITFEGNPTSFTNEKLQYLKNIGVNRLSIGVQSFQEAILKKMGRGDTVKSNKKVLESANTFHFDNVNVDIIYGFQGQEKKDLKKDLDVLMQYKPAHITLYPLFIKKNSPFEKQFGKMPLQKLFLLYQFGSTYLKENGYIQYSKEYFVRQKKYIHRYQDNYLAGKSVYGAGLRARSFLNNTYHLNPEAFKDYYEDKNASSYRLSKKELIIKDTVLGIKRNFLDLQAFQKKHKTSLEKQCAKISELYSQNNLISMKNGILSLSNTGLFYDNYIARHCISCF